LDGEGYGHVGPFGLSNRAFDDYMIDLSIIISPLPLCVNICVRTSGDGKDCAVGGEGISLLWRLVDL
jgi:hypothetical protein